MYKVCVSVYGCSANVSDYEIVLGFLKQAGFKMVRSPFEAEANIILTCIVKRPTMERMLHKIRKLTQLKKPLIIAGCLPKTQKKAIEKINPDASLISPDHVTRIVDILLSTLKGQRVILLKDSKTPKLNLPRCRRNKVIGIVQIGRGCLMNCAFCMEPYRLKLFSYPLDSIVNEVKLALRDGCKEIWITSLDNGCYGFDRNTNLAKLLQQICKIRKKFYVRVGMLNPLHIEKFLEELIEAYKNERIFKFLHIPLQSGSDSILRAMGRGYTAKQFITILEKFRKEIPKLTLATDVIVGFPGESDSDFKKTLNLIKKLDSDVVNISKFAMRERMKGELPRKIINERSKLMCETVRALTFKRNKKWIGWEGDILVDEKIGEKFEGRNFAYKPIVIDSRPNLFGQWTKVKITEAKTNYLIGELL